VTESDNYPQECDGGRQWQAIRIHEEMKEHNVYNHRAKQDERQWHVAVDQQQYAPSELNRGDHEVEMVTVRGGSRTGLPVPKAKPPG
jgi:hypothetical protein